MQTSLYHLMVFKHSPSTYWLHYLVALPSIWPWCLLTRRPKTFKHANYRFSLKLSFYCLSIKQQPEEKLLLSSTAVVWHKNRDWRPKIRLTIYQTKEEWEVLQMSFWNRAGNYFFLRTFFLLNFTNKIKTSWTKKETTELFFQVALSAEYYHEPQWNRPTLLPFIIFCYQLFSTKC